MTLQRYEIFNKVIQLKNISKAAEELHLTQPGLSNAIKSLESDLNLKLLNRNRNGITLTKEGEKIYQYTLQIEKMNEALMQEASHLNGLKTGTVNVGSFSSVTGNWIPDIVMKMQEEYPGIEVNIHEGDYESLEKRVLTGELDCCFNTPIENSGLTFSPLKKDELFCIVSNQHPLHSRNEISVKELSSYPFIKPKKSWDDEINGLFSKYNLSPNIKYEVSEDLPIIALVEANLGINIRPELVLQREKTSKSIRIIKLKEDAYRIIGLCTPTSPSHATQLFVSITKELYEEPFQL
ncbi:MULTISPECIES: LysR family transcriptional regulator [Oceanobacillus]|uniref:LysR family transcriptional regulator n=1 Tax=Oceanobacillus aidingensis TaxID=645964 RepID=A0ABV9K3C8_9BACI|nr:LysR family transcriptional regulator [Oceanobacillus oncorhynchi]MDM8099780.1 LysR family transcriptional regulator [Oceanobacillus oncorhynchi]UUI41775.1 LysR family transcriptional regulator [Oceanobacillus oncorhynchi]